MIRDGHWAGMEYHHTLLDDPVRMDAYDRAIRALVRPGDRVLDLGCGTGVLAMLAARRGAFVHAIESTPIARVARQLIAANGLADQIVVHEANARTMDPIEPVDLVISDFMGRFVADDGMLAALDAAKRWLKPGGRFCPGRIHMPLAPISARMRPVEVVTTSLLGLDLRPASPLVYDGGWYGRVGTADLLADPVVFASFDPADGSPVLDARVSFTLRAGVVRALAGWFDAELAPGVTLGVGPDTDTHWGQYVFAIPAVEVADGDLLTTRFTWDADGERWVWSGTITRGGSEIAAFAGTTDNRMAERELPIGPVATRGRAIALGHHALAVQAFGEGRIRDAAEAWEAAVTALEPKDDDLAPVLAENVGIMRMNLGEYGTAARAFLRAIDGDPAAREQSVRYLPDVLDRGGLPHEAAKWRAVYERVFGASGGDAGS